MVTVTVVAAVIWLRWTSWESVFALELLVCVRLSGRVSGLIRDWAFDLEQEQRPGAGRDAAAAGARGAGP